MNDNKLIKFLIPLIAAVVVFESIVLVNNLEKSNNTSKTEDDQQMSEIVEVEDPVINFSFNSTTSAEVKMGKAYKVSLVLTSDEDRMIDGMETYIKYDPKAVKVTNLVSDKNLAKPEISKVDDEAGIISNVILIEDEKGLSLEAGKELNVLSFSVTPLVEGVSSLKLNTGDPSKVYDTLVVETGTAKSLGWTGGKLDINVIK